MSVLMKRKSSGLANLEYVNRSTGFRRETLVVLPESEKRAAWVKSAEILGWEDDNKEDDSVRTEVEYLFGLPPYNFLHTGDTRHFRWTGGKHNRQNNVLDEAYRYKRPSPNYSNFSGNIHDAKGREYKSEDEPQALKKELMAVSRAVASKKELQFSIKLARNLKTKGVTMPDVDDEITLYHGGKCVGHVVVVMRTLILPNACTGTIWVNVYTKKENIYNIVDCPALRIAGGEAPQEEKEEEEVTEPGEEPTFGVYAPVEQPFAKLPYIKGYDERHSEYTSEPFFVPENAAGMPRTKFGSFPYIQTSYYTPPHNTPREETEALAKKSSTTTTTTTTTSSPTGFPLAPAAKATKKRK